MTQSALTFREMNLRVFRGESSPHVLFQPRFEPWYAYHKRFHRLPPEYQQMSVRDLYDHVQVSMRYIHYFTGIPDPVIEGYRPQVQIDSIFEGGEGTKIYHTPFGDLVERQKFTDDQEWRTIEFPCKTVSDLKALRWLMERSDTHFSLENFQQGSDYVGERGEPQFWMPKSPYMALSQSYMKLEDMIYALVDAPQEVEDTFVAIDASYDRLYQQIIASGAVRIVNFGENLHEAYFNRRSFEKYLIPWYEKRVGQLRHAGIFTHNHIDGYFHALLRYLKDLPFDGLEALTPTPQGDCTLEEIKDHIGDKILLDGIPAVLFLDTFSREELMACVEKVVAYFQPRLVLGVSDEVPEGSEPEAIERLKMVAEWCTQQTSQKVEPK